MVVKYVKMDFELTVISALKLLIKLMVVSNTPTILTIVAICVRTATSSTDKGLYA